jgi:hypothetical protein
MGNVVDNILGTPIALYAMGYRQHREDEYAKLMAEAARLGATGTKAGVWAANQLGIKGHGFMDGYLGISKEGTTTVTPWGSTSEDNWNQNGTENYKEDPSILTPEEKKHLENNRDELWKKYEETWGKKSPLAQETKNNWAVPVNNVLNPQPPTYFSSPTGETVPVDAVPANYFNSATGQTVPIMPSIQPIQSNVIPVPPGSYGAIGVTYPPKKKKVKK